jgi:hypothetical protein
MIGYRSSVWEHIFDQSHYDLIVVGGGLVGQSIAHFYAKKHPGAEILILERGAHPLGASSRNAGFACIGSVTEHLADLELADEETLLDRIRRRYEGLELLKSTLGTKAIEYSEVGGTEIFTDDKVYHQAIAELGRINQWLKEITGQEEVYSPIEINGYPAIFNKVEGMLHSGKMLKCLQKMNQQRGVQYLWNAEAEQLEEKAVFLSNGRRLKARRIAIATNAFSGKLIPDLKIKPGRGYVFVTKPLLEINWKGTFHYNKGYVYFRNVGDDRILLGGGRDQDLKGEETTEFGINPEIKQYLINLANEVLKLPGGWDIELEWSGIMAFTEDHQPILRAFNDHGVLACGLNGMGVAIGMQVGKEAVELLD